MHAEGFISSLFIIVDPPFHPEARCAQPIGEMDLLAVRQAIHDAASKMRGAFLREDPQVQRLCASSHSQPLSPPSRIATYMDSCTHTMLSTFEQRR